MLTDLQTRKFTRMFHMFDVDGNGFVEEVDYLQAVQNLKELYGVAEDSDEYHQLYQGQMGIWQFVCGIADKDLDNRVTLNEFLEGYDFFIQDEEAMNSLLMGMTETMLTLSDTNGDGKLDVSGYIGNLVAFNISEDEARETFNRLDRDQDGYLTRDELTQAVKEFFTSNEPDSPGNWLLGAY
ncbi:MAG: EF-hand domain-containing protein [Chloroflexota bacterium]